MESIVRIRKAVMSNQAFAMPYNRYYSTALFAEMADQFQPRKLAIAFRRISGLQKLHHSGFPNLHRWHSTGWR